MIIKFVCTLFEKCNQLEFLNFFWHSLKMIRYNFMKILAKLINIFMTENFVRGFNRIIQVENPNLLCITIHTILYLCAKFHNFPASSSMGCRRHNYKTRIIRLMTLPPLIIIDQSNYLRWNNFKCIFGGETSLTQESKEWSPVLVSAAPGLGCGLRCSLTIFCRERIKTEMRRSM